jgi:hypothetical protein
MLDDKLGLGDAYIGEREFAAELGNALRGRAFGYRTV